MFAHVRWDLKAILQRFEPCSRLELCFRSDSGSLIDAVVKCSSSQYSHQSCHSVSPLIKAQPCSVRASGHPASAAPRLGKSSL